MRIGVVEVGSRSIRLMVADFQRSGSFKATRTGSHLHGVEIDKLNRSSISDLWAAVDRFYNELQTFECDRVMVYGTALCRKLAEQPDLKLPSYLHVLSAEEEAVASWAAGFMCTRKDAETRQYTIVDQGAGSTEVISATWTGETIDNVIFDSLEVGNQKVMDLFYSSGNAYAKAIHLMVEEFAERIRRHKAAENGRLYLIGSVATKIAWLKVRKGVSDFYKPHLVNDVPLSMKELFELHSNILKLYRQSPEKARALVDSRAGAEDDFARVMSGSVFLMMLCTKLDYPLVRVSGYGVRHGMAFLVLKELI